MPNILDQSTWNIKQLLGFHSQLASNIFSVSHIPRHFDPHESTQYSWIWIITHDRYVLIENWEDAILYSIGLIIPISLYLCTISISGVFTLFEFLKQLFFWKAENIYLYLQVEFCYFSQFFVVFFSHIGWTLKKWTHSIFSIIETI